MNATFTCAFNWLFCYAIKERGVCKLVAEYAQEFEGAHVTALIGHARPVSAIVEPNNGKLVSGSWDKPMRVWDVNTTTCTRLNRLSQHFLRNKKGVFNLLIYLNFKLVKSPRS